MTSSKMSSVRPASPWLPGKADSSYSRYGCREKRGWMMGAVQGAAKMRNARADPPIRRRVTSRGLLHLLSLDFGILWHMSHFYPRFDRDCRNLRVGSSLSILKALEQVLPTHYHA